MITPINFIDLFAGIGGFHIAMHNVGANCVFASEFDEAARKTYRENISRIDEEIFLRDNFGGDITKISLKDIPPFNILCAGFPCQPFSQAGKKKGFNDTRGTLFYNIAEIIAHHKPEAFFLENVRGILNHDNGNTYRVIKNTLEDLGYSFHHKIVRASDHGLPQHRARAFMVGFRGETTEESSFRFAPKTHMVFNMSDVFRGECTREIGFTVRVGGRGSAITDRRNWDAYEVDGEVVRLGPAHARKMMGLPTWFTFNQVSKTQAMKQLGNSVAVPAIQATALAMINYMKEKNYV